MERKKFNIMFPDTPQGNKATSVLMSLPPRKKSRFLCQLILFAEECGKLEDIINEVVGVYGYKGGNDKKQTTVKNPALKKGTKRKAVKTVSNPTEEITVKQKDDSMKPEDDSNEQQDVLLDILMDEDEDDSYWEEEEEMVDPFEQMKRGNNLFTKGGK